MTDSTTEDYITKNHERLLNIAFWANVLAWIVLIINTLMVGWNFYQSEITFALQNKNIYLGQEPDFIEMLLQNPK